MTIEAVEADAAETPQARPLRILHVLTDIDETGSGIVNAAIDLAIGEARLGHDVAVASIGGKYRALLEAHGIPHQFLDQRRKLRPLLRVGGAFGRLIAALAPDIVHCHMVAGVLIARFHPAHRRYRLVAHLHNVHQRSAVLMGLADCVIAVSAGVAKDIERRGIARRRIRVVLPGSVGSARLPAAPCAPAAIARPAVVTVAGMYERKAIDVIIAAFDRIAAEIPDAHLYLVGEGHDRRKFEAQAAGTTAHARIHFAGFQRDPRPYLEAADIFVLASRRESFGIAIIEARAQGCAVIASDVDGIPEALDGGAAGILVPPGDVEALAAAMLALLRDEALRRHWRDKAARGLDRFGVDAAARAVISVYRDLSP